MRRDQSFMTPVAADEFPDYPLSTDERIDHHYFMTWERRRWLNSDMRMKANAECRALYFDLICISYDHSPIGTLPLDLDVLAKLTMTEPGHFRSLCELTYGPLHKWHRYRCDNGEIRFGHAYVVRTLQDAISRKEDNRAKTEAANVSKRLQRLRQTVAGLHLELSKNDAAIRWMDEWLQQEGCGYRSTTWVERGMTAWVRHMRDLDQPRRGEI